MTTQTLEQRKQAIFDQINGMTHRQLVRFGKTLGLSLGDYMKLSKGDLAQRVLSNLNANILTLGDAGAYDFFDAKLAEAFPQGIFHRGQRQETATQTASSAETIPPKPANAGDVGAALALLTQALGACQTAISSLRAVS